MIKILEEIKTITFEEADIHSILVYIFVKKNNIKNIKNNHINNLLKINDELKILSDNILKDL
jgi:hypothetical protein